MKRFRKVALIAGGAVVALLVFAFLAANLYLQSHGTQERIRKDLSRRLGVAVEVAGTSLTPWGGFRLTGVVVPPEASPDGRSSLRAEAFTAHLRPLPLLRGELVIREIVVDGADVVWMQNREGRWQLPTALHESPSAQQPAGSHGVRAESIAVQVDRFKFRRGEFSFLDKKGNPVADLDGVKAYGSIDQDEVHGRVDLAHTKLYDTFQFGRIKSPFAWDANGLSLSEMSGELAGGKIKGDLAMQLTRPKSPFQAHARLGGVDINQLIQDAGGVADKVRGKLGGTIEMSGLSDDSDALRGGGELTLSEGVFEQYELLQMIGQALRIPELMTLKLQQGTMKYRLEGERVLVDQLTLQSDNLRLTSQGEATFDRKLSLHARLAINDEISRHFSRAIANNFATDENGMRCVDFDISGTLNRPRTDLVQRVVGNELQRSVGSLIENLLGPKKKDKPKEKKKKPAEPAGPKPSVTGPVATPVPLPAPSGTLPNAPEKTEPLESAQPQTAPATAPSQSNPQDL